MLRTALRNVLAHRARLLMTVLAVLLGVAFVSGTLVFTSTVSEAYEKSSQKSQQDVDVVLRPHRAASGDTPGEAPNLTQKLLDRVRDASGVAKAEGVASGFVAVSGKDDKLVSEGATSQGRSAATGGGKSHEYEMSEGRAPKRANEVALDAETADRAGYELGDQVRISVSGPVLEQRISGVFSTDDVNVSAGGSLVLFDTATAQQLYAAKDRYNEIAVEAESDVSQASLKRTLKQLLPPEVQATTGKKLAEEEAAKVAKQMDNMRTAMLVFAGISLFVGAFIIVNTFTMLIGQRTRDLALLRAVGATRRQVTRSVLVEALLVGGVAGVVGLPAGVGVGLLLRELSSMTGTKVPQGPLVVPSSAYFAAILLALVITTLAAWLPARRAAKIPPVAAMNSAHTTVGTRSLVVRNTIGTLFAGGGLAAVVGGKDSNALLGLGAGLLVIGVFVLTPLLSRPVVAAVAPLLRSVGITGKLARQNAVRNPRRTASTASALMVGLTLITGLTVIASGVQQAIDKMAAEALKSDFVVVMANMNPLSPEVAETLSNDADVSASSPMRPASAREGKDSVSLAGVDGRTIGDLIDVHFSAGSLDGLSGKRAIVDENTADKHGWKKGSSFTVTLEDGKRETLKVSGVYEGNQMIQGVLTDLSVVTPHLTQVTDSQVMIKTKDGDGSAVKDRLYEKLGSNPALQIQTKDDISQEVAQAISVMLNVLYGLLAMAVFVAVLGVVNTLALSVSERWREIGMLRAIGLSRAGVQQMVRLESVVIALFGGVLGVGLGVFFGWAVGQQISASMPTYDLVLPWGKLALFLAMAIVTGFLAAVWPARKAARVEVLDAMKAS